MKSVDTHISIVGALFCLLSHSIDGSCAAFLNTGSCCHHLVDTGMGQTGKIMSAPRLKNIQLRSSLSKQEKDMAWEHDQLTKFIEEVSTNEKDNLDNNNEQSYEHNELWLDLRGTSLNGRKAIAIMEMEGCNSSLVDGILVSSFVDDKDKIHDESKIGKYVNVLKPQLENGVKNWKSVSLSISLTMNFLEGEPFVNPIPALDHINIGKWVVADCTDVESKEDRHNHLSSLATFLEASSTSNGALDSLSLIPVSELTSTDLKSDDNNKSKGGLAVVCHNIDEFFEASVLSKTFRGSSTTTTESGILIQSDPESMEKRGLKFAITLPFDFALWKSAEDLL